MRRGALGSKWTDLETEGGGMCPTNQRSAAIGLFISEHTDERRHGSEQRWRGAGRGQRLQTGQTTCRDSAGTLIACAGTGHDGELAKRTRGELHRQRRWDDLRQPDRA